VNRSNPFLASLENGQVAPKRNGDGLKRMMRSFCQGAWKIFGGMDELAMDECFVV
jgi:hypothetical protein